MNVLSSTVVGCLGDRTMKNDLSASFGQSVQRFFQDYLPQLRGMSIHTIRSYRDALVLFLTFTTSDTGKSIERIEVGDLSREREMRFLQHLEDCLLYTSPSPRDS